MADGTDERKGKEGPRKVGVWVGLCCGCLVVGRKDMSRPLN